MPTLKLVHALPIIALAGVTGCGSNTEERAATGVLGGAAAGAVVGGPVGAVVGGAVGGTGGTLLPKGADDYAGDAKDAIAGEPSGGAPTTAPAPPPASPPPPSTTP